jgi:hypothetical protein
MVVACPFRALGLADIPSAPLPIQGLRIEGVLPGPRSALLFLGGAARGHLRPAGPGAAAGNGPASRGGRPQPRDLGLR